MEEYKDYFNKLNIFKNKQEIISDIKDIFNKKLSDKEWTALLSKLLKFNIISKSTINKGRAYYISSQFLKKIEMSGPEYFEYQKNNKADIQNGLLQVDNSTSHVSIKILNIQDFFK